MTCIPVRETAVAHASRWWSPGGAHFLTVCTTPGFRNPGLARPQFNSEFHAAAHLIALDRQWHVRTATVMPHHLHLLVTMDENTAIPAVVDRLKTGLAPCLERVGLQWAPGYFDRHLQPGEDHFPVFRYVFGNPYRARLIEAGEPWPGYFCQEEDWAWFGPLARSNCEFPGWLLQWRLYAAPLTPA